jgi:hypothetical protein
LGWQADLESDEFPPDWMLPFDELLVEHFDWVIAKRKDKYGGSSDDDMMDNELAEGRG